MSERRRAEVLQLLENHSDRYQALNPREKDILHLRFLASRIYTLEEIALKYGVSREMIRQIQERSIHKLKNLPWSYYRKDGASLDSRLRNATSRVQAMQQALEVHRRYWPYVTKRRHRIVYQIMNWRPPTQGNPYKGIPGLENECAAIILDLERTHSTTGGGTQRKRST